MGFLESWRSPSEAFHHVWDKVKAKNGVNCICHVLHSVNERDRCRLKLPDLQRSKHQQEDGHGQRQCIGELIGMAMIPTPHRLHVEETALDNFDGHFPYKTYPGNGTIYLPGSLIHKGGFHCHA